MTEGPTRRSREISVLLVEDNPVVSEVLGRLLTTLGCRVVPFPCGGSSLRWVDEIGAQATPDLILIDLGLPDMSGEVLASLLRQKDSLQEARLILHTGHSPSELSNASLALFDEVLPKPASSEDLRRLLARLRRRSLRLGLRRDSDLTPPAAL